MDLDERLIFYGFSAISLHGKKNIKSIKSLDNITIILASRIKYFVQKK